MSKLNYRNLEILPEWQIVKNQIEKLRDSFREDIILEAAKGNVNNVMNLAGRCYALDQVLSLPEAMMPGNPKAED